MASHERGAPEGATVQPVAVVDTTATQPTDSNERTAVHAAAQETNQSWTAASIPDQSGRTFVVTGATRGVGRAVALELARKHAHIVIPARTAEAGTTAMEQMRAVVPRASLEVLPLDLANLATIQVFAARLQERGTPIHGLLNVAGVMATPQGRTADGFETQFGINHLGHFALTGLLLPLLDRAQTARVVTVTSGAHAGARIEFDDLMAERRYRRWRAYGQSKLANVLFTYELQRRLARRGSPTRAIVVGPGIVRTELGQYGGAQTLVFRILVPLVTMVRGMEPAGGALSTLRAATDPNVPGGAYLEPKDGGMRGAPVVGRQTSPLSYDAATAARLWERSIALTGVDYGGL